MACDGRAVRRLIFVFVSVYHAVLAHGSQHQLQVFKVSAHYPRRNPDLHGLLEGLGVFAGGVWHDAVQFGFDGFGHWCEGVQPKVLQGV